MMENPNYSALYDYVYSSLLDNIYFFSFEAENSQTEFFAELEKFKASIMTSKAEVKKIEIPV
jgi:hypothetical protein